MFAHARLQRRLEVGDTCTLVSLELGALRDASNGVLITVAIRRAIQALPDNLAPLQVARERIHFHAAFAFSTLDERERLEKWPLVEDDSVVGDDEVGLWLRLPPGLRKLHAFAFP